MSFRVPNLDRCVFEISRERDGWWLLLQVDGTCMLTAGPFVGREDAKRLLLWLLAKDEREKPTRSERSRWPAQPRQPSTFTGQQAARLETCYLEGVYRLLIFGGEQLLGWSWWFTSQPAVHSLLVWLRGRQQDTRRRDRAGF